MLYSLSQQTCRSVVTRTKFDSISLKSVYVPLYEMSYNHDGKYYKVFINGQTGKVDGERPIGLGMMGDLFSSIEGIFKGEEEGCTFIDGSVLNEQENKKGLFSGKVEGYYYENETQYLLLPTTRSGWVELENLGDTDIEFGCQRRRERRVLATTRLRPGNTSIYNFSGSWCLRLLGGTSDSLRIVNFASNQFSSKASREEANTLFMA